MVEPPAVDQVSPRNAVQQINRDQGIQYRASVLSDPLSMALGLFGRIAKFSAVPTSVDNAANENSVNIGDDKPKVNEVGRALLCEQQQKQEPAWNEADQ